MPDKTVETNYGMVSRYVLINRTHVTSHVATREWVPVSNTNDMICYYGYVYKSDIHSLLQ